MDKPKRIKFKVKPKKEEEKPKPKKRIKFKVVKKEEKKEMEAPKPKAKKPIKFKVVKKEVPKKEEPKKQLKFEDKFFSRLRSFLNDYQSVDGTGIKKVDDLDRKSAEHRKLMNYAEKFDNLMLKRSQAKKRRPFTERQQKSIMEAIQYIKDKFGIDVRKGKTGLRIE